MVEEIIQKKPGSAQRWQLWLLIALFGIPPIASLSLFYAGWRPSTTGNNGTLVAPVRDMNGMALKNVAGDDVTIRNLNGQWIMISVADNLCDETCQNSAYTMRQVRLAIGEGQKYVDRMLIAKHLPENWHDERFNDVYKGMLVVDSNAGDGGKLLDDLSRISDPVNGSIFLVDPAGNLMMFYPPGEEAKAILKDMQTLFKVTQFH